MKKYKVHDKVLRHELHNRINLMEVNMNHAFQTSVDAFKADFADLKTDLAKRDHDATKERTRIAYSVTAIALTAMVAIVSIATTLILHQL